MSRTGNAPTRYCNQCGKEDHGSAGCHGMVGIQHIIKVQPQETYRIVGGELRKVDFVNLPPGAKSFELSGREK